MFVGKEAEAGVSATVVLRKAVQAARNVSRPPAADGLTSDSEYLSHNRLTETTLNSMQSTHTKDLKALARQDRLVGQPRGVLP